MMETSSTDSLDSPEATFLKKVLNLDGLNRRALGRRSAMWSHVGCVEVVTMNEFHVRKKTCNFFGCQKKMVGRIHFTMFFF